MLRMKMEWIVCIAHCANTYKKISFNRNKFCNVNIDLKGMEFFLLKQAV